MTLYAHQPARRTLQVLGDGLFLAWIYLCIETASAVHDATLALGRPGELTASAAQSLGENLTGAGDYLQDLPIVGDEAAVPFDRAASASQDLAGAGEAQVAAVEELAWWLRLVVIAVPILAVAAWYLPGRIRFVRRATAGRRFLDSAADLDLFALRALTHQPLHVLARVSDDPAGAWRRGDERAIKELASLELLASGLRPPNLVGP